MTTAAAGNVAGTSGEKEKEKMEKRRALGRGLASLLPGPRPVAPPAAASSQVAAGDLSAGGQQVPHFVRNDNVVGERFEGTIQAVVESPADVGGQPGAAVPTYSSSSPSVSTSASPSSPAFTSPGNAESNEPITLMAQAESRVPGNIVVNLAITDIEKNPFQTRYVGDDEALEELADSIKANGVVQPIMVRPSDEDEGRYILFWASGGCMLQKSGEDAHPGAGAASVAATSGRDDDHREPAARRFERTQQAEAFRVLSKDFNLTQQQIGERVGLSRVSVANYMRLLKLPREVMELLAEKRINFAQRKSC